MTATPGHGHQRGCERHRDRHRQQHPDRGGRACRLEHPDLGEDHGTRSSSDRQGRGNQNRGDPRTGRRNSSVRVFTRTPGVVVARDLEDRVVGSGAQHQRRHDGDREVRDRHQFIRAEERHDGPHGAESETDGRQRNQGCDERAVGDQQHQRDQQYRHSRDDEQRQIDRREEIGKGGRGACVVHRQTVWLGNGVDRRTDRDRAVVRTRAADVAFRDHHDVDGLAVRTDCGGAGGGISVHVEDIGDVFVITGQNLYEAAVVVIICRGDPAVISKNHTAHSSRRGSAEIRRHVAQRIDGRHVFGKERGRLLRHGLLYLRDCQVQPDHQRNPEADHPPPMACAERAGVPEEGVGTV